MKPDTYERLQQLFAKFSSFPEIGHTDIGVTVRKDAFVAFLRPAVVRSGTSASDPLQTFGNDSMVRPQGAKLKYRNWRVE